MKKLTLTLGALTVLALGVIAVAGSVPGSAALDDGAVETTVEMEAAAPVTPDLGAPAAGCEVEDPLAAPGQQQQACCIDQCHRDRDCRLVCGKEFGGQCVMVNSCCRECFCFGFATGPGLPS